MDWKKVFTPPTVAAAALLLVAIVAFQAALFATGTHLIKGRVDLRQHLYFMPADVGPYHKMGDETLSKEMAEELGAEEFITSVYQDATSLHAEETAVRFHVAYHTGEPDSVPHIPDRCALAGESTRGTTTSRTLRLVSKRISTDRGGRVMAARDVGPEVRLPAAEFPVRVFDYKPQNSSEHAGVVYFFVCNGRLYATAEEVQAAYRDPALAKGYWCRIEVQPRGSVDSETFMPAVARFLGALLPEVAASLPEIADDAAAPEKPAAPTKIDPDRKPPIPLAEPKAR